MMTQLVILLIALASVHLTCVHAKGGAAKGGAAGGGASSGPGGPRTWGPGEVEEIEEALIVLGVILMCFICICAAQIYQRAKYELVHTSKQPRSMPVAPYTREASTV